MSKAVAEQSITFKFFESESGTPSLNCNPASASPSASTSAGSIDAPNAPPPPPLASFGAVPLSPSQNDITSF